MSSRSTSTTTNQDQRVVADNGAVVAAPNSTLVLPGGVNADGPVNYNYSYEAFTPEVRDSIKYALDLVGGMSSGLIQSNEKVSDSSNDIAKGLQGTLTIIAESLAAEKGVETPSYSKYLLYGILGLMAIMIIKR